MNETIQGELNRRNTETMTNKLNEMDARVYAQTAKIDSLINTIGTMAARIQTLETQLLLFKVKTAGTGPTAD